MYWMSVLTIRDSVSRLSGSTRRRFSRRVFDFGNVDTEGISAEGAYAQALAEYREATLKAVQDVEDAFMALARAEPLTEELRREVPAFIRAIVTQKVRA